MVRLLRVITKTQIHMNIFIEIAPENPILLTGMKGASAKGDLIRRYIKYHRDELNGKQCGQGSLLKKGGNKMMGLKIKWYLVGLICFSLAFFTMMSGAAQAIRLDLGTASGTPGSDVTIPITLDYLGATPNIAATSNDIGFNTGLLENPTASLGPAGTAANKMVIQNLRSPGVFRVGVIGLNQNIIQGGIAAYVTFRIKSGATPGGYEFNEYSFCF